MYSRTAAAAEQLPIARVTCAINLHSCQLQQQPQQQFACRLHACRASFSLCALFNGVPAMMSLMASSIYHASFSLSILLSSTCHLSLCMVWWWWWRCVVGVLSTLGQRVNALDSLNRFRFAISSLILVLVLAECAKAFAMSMAIAIAWLLTTYNRQAKLP